MNFMNFTLPLFVLLVHRRGTCPWEANLFRRIRMLVAINRNSILTRSGGAVLYFSREGHFEQHFHEGLNYYKIIFDSCVER